MFFSLVLGLRVKSRVKVYLVEFTVVVELVVLGGVVVGVVRLFKEARVSGPTYPVGGRLLVD